VTPQHAEEHRVFDASEALVLLLFAERGEVGTEKIDACRVYLARVLFALVAVAFPSIGFSGALCIASRIVSVGAAELPIDVDHNACFGRAEAA
jgi:hypothetical protein